MSEEETEIFNQIKAVLGKVVAESNGRFSDWELSTPYSEKPYGIETYRVAISFNNQSAVHRPNRNNIPGNTRIEALWGALEFAETVYREYIAEKTRI